MLFNKDQSYLYSYPAARAGSFQIPSSVTLICGGAFQTCANLAAVTIPSGVTNLNTYAFAGCTSLTNVTIPASVTFLGSAVFDRCTNLSTVFFAGRSPGFGPLAHPMPAFANNQANVIGYLPPSRQHH